MDIKHGIDSNLINFIRPYPIINYFIRKTKNLPQKGFKDKKQRPPAKGNQVAFKTIKQLSSQFPVLKLCKLMKISRSAYYAWLKRPAKLITAEQLSLYRRAKAIFEQSRNSLGYRTLRKRLCKEGFSVSAYGVQKLMAQLGLVVTQRVAYKVTTKRKHSDAVADN